MVMPIVLKEPLPCDTYSLKALVDMLTALPRSHGGTPAETMLAYSHGRNRLRVAYSRGSLLADWYLRGLGESHYKTLGFAAPVWNPDKVVPIGPFPYAPGCSLCVEPQTGTCATCVVYVGLKHGA